MRVSCKTLTIILFALLGGATGFGQSSFQEITPGQSTRADVARVLGQPVRTVSATRFEYNPPAGIANVEVEFDAGSTLVKRLEVYFLKPVSRPALIKQFNLPQQADAKTTDAERKLVEYFGDPSLLAMTYTSADPGTGVSRISYYSRGSFESIIASIPGARRPSSPGGGQRSSCFAIDSGMASTDRVAHFNWAQQQSAARLDANLRDKLNLLFTCPSMTSDQLSSAFSDLSVIIARRMRNWECFGGDRGVLSEDWAAHKEWASVRTARDLLTNLQWKVSAALKCMDRSGKSILFAASSVAIAKASLGGSGAASPQD
jgi:hypothetical protein